MEEAKNETKRREVKGIDDKKTKQQVYMRERGVVVVVVGKRHTRTHPHQTPDTPSYNTHKTQNNINR